jgi:hypothetical protein
MADRPWNGAGILTITFGCEPADWGFIGLPMYDPDDMPDWEETLAPVAGVCGQFSAVKGVGHMCICVELAEHKGSHRCGTCGRNW